MKGLGLMERRNRGKSLLLAVGILLLVLMAMHAFLGGASVAKEEDEPPYEYIKRFTDALSLVQQHYVEEVGTKKLIYGAIKGMLSDLDPHSSFLPPEMFKEMQVETQGSFGGLGIEITIRDGVLTVVSPIEDTPAFRAGIKAGDRIIKIDGEMTKDMTLMEAVRKMRGPKGSEITISIMRSGLADLLDVTIVRDIIHIQSVKHHSFDKGICYLRLTQFQERTAEDMAEHIAGMAADGPIKGMILDLRNNPGGLVTAAVAVSDDFLNSGTIVTMRGRLRDANLSFSAHPGDLLNGAPMVDLVNNGTASAAEIVSGALKDNHRALIVGQRTFGKGVVQTVLPLDADHAVKITTARYYTPNGTSIQAEGIKPDIALGDLTASVADTPAMPINSEADLPHHLANQNADGSSNIDNDGSAQSTKLATQDYALSQALNILKGLALNHAASNK